MQYRADFDIEDFKFWDHAKDVYERCVREDKVKKLEYLIELIFKDFTPSDVDINDFVAFDAEDYIFD